MRLLAVTEAIPQKNWATIAMKMMNLAVPRPTGAGDQPWCGVDEERVVGVRRTRWHRMPQGRLGIAWVIARFRKKAAIADT